MSLNKMKLALLAALSTASAANGQNVSLTNTDGVILSEDYGNGANIGGFVDLREGLAAAELSGQQIADEFNRLCLDTNLDDGAHSAAAAASSWGFAPHEAVFPADRKLGEVRIKSFRAASAHTTFWSGDGAANLKGRAHASRSRGAIMTGPTDPKDLYAPQCSLSLKTRALSDAAPLAAALEQAIGSAPAKLVVKKGFADGHWQLSGADGVSRRVAFDAVDLKKSEQLVHVTIQVVPGKKN